MEKRPKLAHWSILILIYGVAAATLVAHTFGHKNISLAKTSDCHNSGSQIIVELKNNHFVPEIITASRCDELQIINNDDAAHELALGKHPRHVQYPGFSERPLAPHQSMRLRLQQAGDYELHDHLLPDMQASLIIKE